MSVTPNIGNLLAIKARLEDWLEKLGFFEKMIWPSYWLGSNTRGSFHIPYVYDQLRSIFGAPRRDWEWQTKLDDMTVYITCSRDSVFFHVWPDEKTSFHYVSNFDEEKGRFQALRPSRLPIIVIGEGENQDAKGV